MCLPLHCTLQAGLAARVEELQEALMRKTVDMAEALMNLKADHAEQRDAQLRS